MEIVTLPAGDIGKLLDRQRRPGALPVPTQLDEVLRRILYIADQFVPSEAGSIVLDDPWVKRHTGNPLGNELVFVACYGQKAARLLGTRVAVSQGIIGRTYVSGEPYLSNDTYSDKHFLREVDLLTDYRSESIICVPIKIELSTCGAIELVNRRDSKRYADGDLQLLDVFAGHISSALQAALDANRAEELARRDDLTGLFNDRHFHLRLSQETARAVHERGELSLVFLDLDHFKDVNDSYGHLVGSQALHAIGGVLAATAREAVIARYGGDEFALVLPGLGREPALALAEEIRAAIERARVVVDVGVDGLQPVDISGTITASVGVFSLRDCRAVTGGERQLKNELIRLADQAMYAAKAAGKNRVVYGGYR